MVELEDQPVAQRIMAETIFKNELKEDENINRYVVGGIWGITLLGSDTSDEYIDLKTYYQISFPLKFFSFHGIGIYQESKSKKWTGKSIERRGEDTNVYITKYGKAYHKTKSCQYLDLSIQQVKLAEIEYLRNKNDHKYYGCELCAEKNTNPDMVYITSYGTTYHTDISCAGLKRSIYLVDVSNVGTRHPCSKCMVQP